MDNLATAMAESQSNGQRPPLSRAVSHVELADALTALPSEPIYFKHGRPTRYTQEEILALRPKDGGHVEIQEEIVSPPPEAIMTPPEQMGAFPPPPTPATPGSIGTVTPDEYAEPPKETFTRPASSAVPSDEVEPPKKTFTRSTPLAVTAGEANALKKTWDRPTQPETAAQVAGEGEGEGEGEKKKKKKKKSSGKSKKQVTGFEGLISRSIQLASY